MVAMSYEYKELIKTYTEYIMDDYEVVDYIEAGKELDHVYRQAAKADEYEAKAKAFDSLKNNLEKEVEILIDKVSGFPYVDAPIESTISHFEHVLEMMKNYESGERNEYQ